MSLRVSLLSLLACVVLRPDFSALSGFSAEYSQCQGEREMEQGKTVIMTE